MSRARQSVKVLERKNMGRRLGDAVNASVRALMGESGRGQAGILDTLESRIMMSASDVVINEIMYNSATAETGDEYVELYNKGTTPVNMTGWTLKKGVDYTFGNRTLNAGAYLVVSADLTRFAQKYPGVSNVVGPWTGHLSNSADSIELDNGLGEQIDQVDYAQDGDWAARRIGGLDPKAVSSVTRSGTTATFTVLAHGYSNGTQVAVFGANQGEYDGKFTVANSTTNTFDLTVSGTPVSPATGQIYVRAIDNKHFGVDWFSAAAGGGKSLELINPNLSNNQGQNWGSSIPDNGTPGAANSIVSTNIAPFISDLSQFPIIPKSTDQVTITARIADELNSGLNVQLDYRKDGDPSFTTLTMFDDGAHGDGSALDGVYGAKLPAQVNGTIVEFYVKATDSTNHSRTLPGPTDVTGVQGANALYQVDDTPYSGTEPLFKLIMTAADSAELASIEKAFPDDLSNAAFNGTFISVDGSGTDIRYHVAYRNRGGGSRIASVSNYRIDFTNFQPWHNEVKLNLNGTWSTADIAGSALASRAGIASQFVTPVKVLVNNTDLSSSGDADGMFGTYAYVEAEDNAFVQNHFPTDSQGNYYRGTDGGHAANLSFIDNNPASYYVKYPKETNKEANDYTDLINLTKALSAPSTGTNAAAYAAGIKANLDVAQWMRYFAFNILIGNFETSLGTGYGDDFSMFRGINDPHFQLVAHDLDSILTLGDPAGVNPSPPAVNQNLFRATAVATIAKLMEFPEFASIYFQQLKDLAQNVFTQPEMSKVLHHALDGFVPTASVDAAVNQAAARGAAVLAAIPQTLDVTGMPAMTSGYPRVSNTATLNAMVLSGTADAVNGSSVLVNGKAGAFTVWKGTWTITNTGNTLGLQGGLNRVIVQELNANNVEVGRTFVDVWYSGPAGTNVAGAIAANTTWSPANGPYRVTANITVNAGATLTIQPGTDVYFAAGTKLTVLGTLNAVGTDFQHIRFTHDPAVGNTSTASWGGIYLSNTSQANKLSYSDIEYAGVGGPDTQIANSVIDMDHDTWARAGTGQRIIDITGTANFSLTNSIVGSLQQQENVHYLGSPVTRAIFQGNIFGTTTNAPGFKNDVIDFTGGNRPGGIVQFLNNVFVGSGTTFGDGDDLLDLDGTDAHIEGNVFMNVAHSATTDTNSAISGGADSGNTSEIVSARNFFYNVDHAFLMKEGNSVTSINDTFVNVITAPFNFSEPGFAPTPGLGAYADGDVFLGIPTGGNGQAVMIDNPPTGSFTVRHSIMPGTTPYTGSGNIAANAQLVHPTGVGIANSNVNIGLIGLAAALDSSLASHLAPFFETGSNAPDLSLKPSSPGIDAGPNGVDMGAEIPAGATISGVPVNVFGFNTLTLQVGGPAIFGYQWKLDNVAYSATVNVTNPMTANALIPPIVLSSLSNGTHTVSILALNDAGVLQSQSQPTVSNVFTINTGLTGRVRINEILADNVSALTNGATHPDAIELYNDGKGTIDLSDYSISDDPAVPRKFVFPAGTTLAQGAYLVVYADNPSAAPGIHLGFSLSASGESVYLYNKLSAGGGVVDSVTFGVQLADKSIGRVGPSGTTWALTTPTLGAANVAINTGDPSTLKINEWLADGLPPFSADFVELYNPEALPVALGGMSITDKTNGWPDQNVFAPLSFIDGAGYLKLVADGDSAAGGDHVNFQLNHDRGEIGLFDSSLNLVDWVFYNAQTSGVSEGLSPDGSSNYVFFNQPNPGLSNPTANLQDVTLNLSKLDDVWKYNQTSQFNDQSWTVAGFADGSWQTGAGVIYHEDASLPWTKNTELADAAHPYSATNRTYYFRRTFNVDNPASISVLHLNVLIDDGAVFYINGQEVKRIGMAAGAVTYSTLANRSVSDAVVEGEFLIPSSYLVAGQNTLAVEVHQSATNSTDLTFGMTLDATEPAIAVPPPPLRVTELMYNPPGSSAVAGDEYEYIELQNNGTSPLNITGYKFAAGVDFTFPNLILAPGAKTLVVKDLAAFTARYGNTLPIAGQYTGSLDNGGEVLRLETGSNLVIQDFSYSDTWFPSTDGSGDSLVINDPNANVATWSTAGAWHASTATLGTPGINETVVPPQNAVVVNEVLANSPGGANDWIELKNTTNAAIDIGGWYLSDSGDNLFKYQVPSGTIIPANGFVTFGQQQTFGSVYQGTNAFGLSEAGDDVFVSSSATTGILGAYRTGAHFGASAPGVTMGRFTTTTGRVDFVALSKATHAAENAYPMVGPVVINEINYHPLSTKDEWIEIKNITSATVPLYDPANVNDTWALSDGVDFTFPTGLSLAPGEIMIIVPDSISAADFRTKYGISASVQVVGGYTGALDNSGEHVALSKPGLPQLDLSVPQILVDDVDYGTATPWPASPDGTGPALARFVETDYGNDVANWRASTAAGGTPSGVNDSSPVTATGQFLELSANKLTFQFSKNVQASLATSDLQLTNLTTGQPVATGSISLSYNATSNIATFTFPGLANGSLATGRYRALLLASGIDSSGVHLDGNADGTPGDNYTFDFVHLPGDANGDGKVDFIDFQRIETNYGKTGATWADGDFNYDGTVNDPDVRILIAALNTSLPAAPLPSDPVPASPVPQPVPVKPAPIVKPAPTSTTPVTTPVGKPTSAPAKAAAIIPPAPASKPAPLALPFSSTRISKTKDLQDKVWA